VSPVPVSHQVHEHVTLAIQSMHLQSVRMSSRDCREATQSSSVAELQSVNDELNSESPILAC
jgi:hypothetical protein